jgi:hypothetical protein
MGKVVIKIKLTNLFDLGAQHRKLSFVVDSRNRKLISNPEHGGQQMAEEY